MAARVTGESREACRGRFASRVLLGVSFSFTSSVQSGAHGTRCEWECFKGWAAGAGESQEGVDGVVCCAALRAVFHSWVRVGVRWCLGSWTSAPPL